MTNAVNFNSRRAGVLLPIFSLPSPYGIGTLGRSAYDFVDFLSSSGNSYWQMLPLNPTSYGDSPYSSPSSMAGNPYFIDLDFLVDDGLLTKEDLTVLAFVHHKDDKKVDYGFLYSTLPHILEKAFLNFKQDIVYMNFTQKNAYWLNDYSLFMAIKELEPTKIWTDWNSGLKFRDPLVLAEYQEELKHRVNYYNFLQFVFFKQWQKLKDYANSKGVYLIGDIPIYVAQDSCDVWANGDLFELDANLTPKRVAGCPPDYFSKDGQLWGNPLYNWQAHKQSGYGWWLARLGHNLELFDGLRIDHFRAFSEFYAIPAQDKTAKNGVWELGGGKDFIKVVNEWFNFPPIIAEDLGFLTDGVRELLDFSGYPGMRVLSFGFSSSDGTSEHLPHNYAKNLAVYTGTHDNDTVIGLYKASGKAQKSLMRNYVGALHGKELGTQFARSILTSVANTAIVPLQDYLNICSTARVNTPSTLGGTNWQWRLSDGELTVELASKIRELVVMSGR